MIAIQRDEVIRQIALPAEARDRRHEDVFGERLHHRRERSAENHADAEVDDAAFEGELLELANQTHARFVRYTPAP